MHVRPGFWRRIGGTEARLTVERMVAGREGASGGRFVRGGTGSGNSVGKLLLLGLRRGGCVGRRGGLLEALYHEGVNGSNNMCLMLCVKFYFNCVWYELKAITLVLKLTYVHMVLKFL